MSAPPTRSGRRPARRQAPPRTLPGTPGRRPPAPRPPPAPLRPKPSGSAPTPARLLDQVRAEADRERDELRADLRARVLADLILLPSEPGAEEGTVVTIRYQSAQRSCSRPNTRSESLGDDASGDGAELPVLRGLFAELGTAEQTLHLDRTADYQRARLAAGDDHALAEVFDRLGSAVYGTALRVTGERRRRAGRCAGRVRRAVAPSRSV